MTENISACGAGQISHFYVTDIGLQISIMGRTGSWKALIRTERRFYTALLPTATDELPHDGHATNPRYISSAEESCNTWGAAGTIIDRQRIGRAVVDSVFSTGHSCVA